MIKNIICGIAIIGLSGCTGSVKNDLINKVDNKCVSCVKYGCTIALKDITKFKWDKMYLFGSWTISDSITKIIGFEYHGDDVPDDYTRMLFCYRGKVIYEEDFKSLDYYNSTLEFDYATDSLARATPSLIDSNTVFNVEKAKTNGACKTCFYYTLSAIKK